MTKKYPRVNWKQISAEKKAKFDRIEEIVYNYLHHIEDWYGDRITAYNLAFLIVTDNNE